MANFLTSLITGRASRAGNSNEQATRGTQYGSLAVAQFEPDWLELSRAGHRFHGGCQVIANGIAPVTAIPTTTATLCLYNAEQAGGRSYLVEEIAFALGSGTPTAGAALLIAVSNGPVATAPTMASNYAVQSMSAGGKATRAVFGTAVTLPASSVWRQVGGSQQLAAANVGQSERPYPLRGLILPPGYGLGIAILSGTGTTPLFAVSAAWSELALDLE